MPLSLRSSASPVFGKLRAPTLWWAISFFGFSVRGLEAVLLAMSLMVAFIYGLNESKPGDFDKPAYTDEERYEQAYQRALRKL
jgi:hypothetical protein